MTQLRVGVCASHLWDLRALNFLEKQRIVYKSHHIVSVSVILFSVPSITFAIVIIITVTITITTITTITITRIITTTTVILAWRKAP